MTSIDSMSAGSPALATARVQQPKLTARESIAKFRYRWIPDHLLGGQSSPSAGSTMPHRFLCPDHCGGSFRNPATRPLLQSTVWLKH